MPSSYTQSLRLVLPVEGENTGTWGDIVNAGLTELVEDAIAGTAAVAMPDANSTLTVANEAVDQARNMFLTLTGTLTAQRDLVVPSVSKLYFVGNGTTGGFGVQVKTLLGSGVVIPPGLRMPVYCDGVNVSFALGSSVGRAVLMADTAEAARTALGIVDPTPYAETLLLSDDAAEARALLGTDIYKIVPKNISSLVTGECYVTSASFTLDIGLMDGATYMIYNSNTSTLININQGSGLTLRLAGTNLAGSRTLASRGLAMLYVLNASEYILTGPGVA